MNGKAVAVAIVVAVHSMLACGRSPAANAGTAMSAPAAPLPTTDTAAKKPPTDLDQFAERVVRQSAGVKTGETVSISGNPRDLELLEDLAVHVRKLGAFPIVIANTDRMAKRMFTEVQEQYDSQTSQLALKLAQLIDVEINVDSSVEEGLLADADPKRMAAQAKANSPVAEAALKHRSIDIGNNLYPTAWRAKHLAWTQDELSSAFWGAVNVDYSDLQARAAQIKAALSSANEIHITDSNGTDFKVRVQGRPWGVSDGIISPEDLKKGGADTHIYLPAGEVFVTPVPGTAEGKIVLAKHYFLSKEFSGLTVTFTAGRLVSMTGTGPGFELLKAQYDAAGPGKELFALIDFGINSNFKLPTSSQVSTWIPAGTLSVGWGNNLWAGGDNKTPYSYFAPLPSTTVTVDGKPVIENGQLKL